MAYLPRGMSPRLSSKVRSSAGVNAPTDDTGSAPGTPVENMALTSLFHPWHQEGAANHRAGPA